MASWIASVPPALAGGLDPVQMPRLTFEASHSMTRKAEIISGRSSSHQHWFSLNAEG
jgi:hypothetical protein